MRVLILTSMATLVVVWGNVWHDFEKKTAESSYFLNLIPESGYPIFGFSQPKPELVF
jgi:hypothetical protein